MVSAKSSVGKVADGAAAAARNVRFRNLNGAVLMSRFRRERLAAKHGLKPRDMAFLAAVVEFTRSWRIVGAGADARVVSDEAYPSQRTLAEMTGYSVRSMALAAASCAKAGLLVVTRGTARRDDGNGEWVNCTNRYRVTLPASEVCPDAVDTVEAVTASGNALALVREEDAGDAPATRGGGGTDAQRLQHPPAKTASDCSDSSKGSASSSRRAAAEEEEEVSLCLSDGRTVTSAKRGGGGNFGGFLSDGRRFGCDEATMSALRAGAAVEAREQSGGYSWLVEAAQGRSRDAEGLRESRTSDCRTRLLLRPDECRVERDEAQECWLFHLDGIESPVGFTFDEQMARLFDEGKALVADSAHGEIDGAWCAYRKASNGDANGEVALGKPKSAEGRTRSSWAS
jgi:hypothetical protein